MASRPKLFDRVLTAVAHALIWFKPNGDRDEQSISYNSITAEQIMNEIRFAADPSLPIAKGSTRQHAMAMLKDKLGDLRAIDIPMTIGATRSPRFVLLFGNRHSGNTNERMHLRAPLPHWRYPISK